ncbi:MAG TPA: cob(I)yrinic acid a,c-diamide adenosyltransferase [Nitrososphaerales archaeon]
MSKYSKSNGIVIVYTGRGKGKTTAALGLALRAIGYDWKICMIQFIKGTWITGELDSVKLLSSNFEIIRAGEGFIGIIDDTKQKKIHKESAINALRISKNKIDSGLYNIVILDEINYALSLRLIKLKDILEIIKSRPRNVTLVLTGDHAHKRIIEIANLVTEMKEIKHPYRNRSVALKGIDF